MDPIGLGNAMMALGTKLWANPAEVMNAQFSLWQDYLRLWNSTTSRMFGGEPEEVVMADRSDRRFKDVAWEENPLFDFIKQSYLLTSRFLLKTVSDTEGLDEKTLAAALWPLALERDCGMCCRRLAGVLGLLAWN